MTVLDSETMESLQAELEARADVLCASWVPTDDQDVGGLLVVQRYVEGTGICDSLFVLSSGQIDTVDLRSAWQRGVLAYVLRVLDAEIERAERRTA